MLAKGSGLVISLAIAIVALFSSTAFASSAFEAEEFPANVSGEQVGEGLVLELPKLGEVECSTATFTGQLAEPSETLTLVPTYYGCTAFGQAASIERHGCVYELNVGEETGENTFAGSTDIVCPPEQAIVVNVLKAGACDAKIGGQSGLSSVAYQDDLEAEPLIVTAEEGLSSIKYTPVGGGCPSAGEDGSLTGDVELSAETETEAVGLAVWLDANTKLCQEIPNPCNNLFTKNTTIAGTSMAAQIFIEKAFVSCTSSSFTATSDADEGDPLPLRDLAVTFGGCFTENAKCVNVKMTNKPSAALSAWGGPISLGSIFFPVSLFIECEKKVECEYESPKLAMRLVGGSPAKIVFHDQALTKKVLGTEVGCGGSGAWTGGFTINNPKAGIWVFK